MLDRSLEPARDRPVGGGGKFAFAFAFAAGSGDGL